MTQSSAKIKVSFIDHATGETFAVAELPPDALLESFERATTLRIGDADWSVVDASPKTRVEYVKSQALKLRLCRIEKVNPKDILFSLPTICDPIPAINNQPVSGREFQLAEDDWRQVELVSNVLAHEVDAEIAKIRLIHEQSAVDIGWREIHVRSNPVSPLVCNLTLADLAKALGVSAQSTQSTQSNGVTYYGAPSQIADGYSLTTEDGLTIYGIAPNDKVQVIAVDEASDLSANTESIGRLKALAQDLELDLVYWCRCLRVAPNNPWF